MHFQHSITPARSLFDLKLQEIWRYRDQTVDGHKIEFSGGFTDLHTASYHSIINGNGYGLQDALPSVQIVQKIREPLVYRVIA